MPGKCCVPRCNGNYKTGPKVHVFSFPKIDKVRKAWIRAIPRENLVVSANSRVCERHFKTEDIVRKTSYIDEATGRTVTASLSHVRLRPDAVPTVFPDCPSYLSREGTRREDPESKRMRLDSAALEKVLAKSIITAQNEDEADKLCDLKELANFVREASPGELGRKDKSEQRQSLGQWVVTEDCSWRKTQATQCKSYVDQVRTLGSQAETGHVMAETSAQTAMVFPCTIPAQTRPTHLQQKKLLATVSTNPKMPLPRLKPGGMPGNLLATAAAPVMKKQTAELPNFKAIVCLSNSKSPQGEPMCAIGGGNLHPSILPIVPPIMSATPCNFKTKLSQSELLSLSTDASSRLHNLPSGPAIVFSSPNHTGTGIARQTKLLCSPSGASSRDIQLSSAPVALPNTPLSSEISQPLVLCFSQDSSSSNAHQPLSEPKVVQATLHHAETQLSQSRLLCLSSNSLLPNMPTLPLTTLCRAEAPHLATAENCVTLITVPVMQVCTTESPSFACSQDSPRCSIRNSHWLNKPPWVVRIIKKAQEEALSVCFCENAHTSLNDHLEPHSSSADTQLEQERHRKATLCNSCVDQVRTLGSQTETGHVMVETSTQTAMVLPRTIPVQTRPTKLRSQGTNTVPE
ncbi:uncharacterized protein [Dermacentor andersoni]|uniref:uncharacterized protein isoform X5 n=1 Tax=Dermacentor andersoni TaxID=34620 RepID=UPI002417824E|nr:uncharacterized protein LOC126523563 isoform X5 [Dermacentor andersoni]